MGAPLERFSRMVRHPSGDENILRPPEGLLTVAEELGRDPRRPKTALARLVSAIWYRQAQDMRTRLSAQESLPMIAHEREILMRPSHYPTDMGLGFAVHPEQITGFNQGIVQCFTSLDVPRPFDPNLHGDITTSVPGMGFAYLGTSSWTGRYDITARRGGGARGGFAYTTGPTEGTFPTSVLPQPTFDLGNLGFTNGGWQPEGLKYTNRPKHLRLHGLKNGITHKVMFARSRQVMFRNVYGNLSEDYAQPQAPMIVVNGNKPLKGIKTIALQRAPNAPTIVEFTFSSINGERTGLVAEFDTVQVFLAQENVMNPPLVFTGFVSSIAEGEMEVKVECKDALGYLELETLQREFNYQLEDATAVIRAIVGESSYAVPVNGMLQNSRLRLPVGIKLKGKTRLAAVQTILASINAGARKMFLSTSPTGMPIIEVGIEPKDAVAPLRGGEFPRTDVPLDVLPIGIVRNQGTDAKFNVAIVENPELQIEAVFPKTTSSDYPNRPVVRRFIEKAATTQFQAELFAKNFLNQQSDLDSSWTVRGIPSRYDIKPGDTIEFATKTAGLSGRYRVFNVKYMVSTTGRNIELNIGRAKTSLVEILRFISDKQ